MDVILVLFGMSYADALSPPQTPEYPQAVVYKVFSTENTKKDDYEWLWDTPPNQSK